MTDESMIDTRWMRRDRSRVATPAEYRVTGISNGGYMLRSNDGYAFRVTPTQLVRIYEPYEVWP